MPQRNNNEKSRRYYAETRSQNGSNHLTLVYMSRWIPYHVEYILADFIESTRHIRVDKISLFL